MSTTPRPRTWCATWSPMATRMAAYPTALHRAEHGRGRQPGGAAVGSQPVGGRRGARHPRAGSGRPRARPPRRRARGGRCRGAGARPGARCPAEGQPRGPGPTSRRTVVLDAPCSPTPVVSPSDQASPDPLGGGYRADRQELVTADRGVATSQTCRSSGPVCLMGQPRRMRTGRRSAYVACAPAAASSSAGWLVVTPMTCPTPADRAAAMPASESSTAQACSARDAQAAGGEQEPGRVGLAVDDVVGGDDLVDDGEQVADRDLHPVGPRRGHDGDGDPRGVSGADQVVGAGDRGRPSVVGHAVAHLRAEGGRVVAGPRARLGGEDVVGAAAGEEREVGLGPATGGEERAVAGALDLLGVDEGAVEVEEQRGRGRLPLSQR